MVVHGLPERSTNDLDFFTPTPADVPLLRRALEIAFRKAGLTVAIVRPTTLVQWVEEFLRTAHDLDPSTRATYERDLRRYGLPRFGETTLCKIRELDVRAATTSWARGWRPARSIGTSALFAACSTSPSSTSYWPGRPVSA